MFNNIFCEMKGKKVIHWGAPGGMGEPFKLLLGSVISVFTWSWISKYITWIFKYITWNPSNNCTFMLSIGSWCVIIHLSIIHVFYKASWKVTFPVTQKPTPSTGFNLQASDWVHCEEETGAYYQLSRFTYKLVIYIFF